MGEDNNVNEDRPTSAPGNPTSESWRARGSRGRGLPTGTLNVGRGGRGRGRTSFVSKVSNGTPQPSLNSNSSTSSSAPQFSPNVTSPDSEKSSSDDDEDDQVIKQPPLAPLTTFWTPIVFHCPLPDCSPETLPMGNPYKVLDHIKDDHGFVIVNPEQVMPFLDRYITMWSKRIAEVGIEQCGFQLSNIDGKDVWLVGAAAHEEDHVVRKKLQSEKLKEMLALQERERQEDAFLSRKCLFCKIVCENRAHLFRHMFNEHGFNVGLPDNLVEINELLDTLNLKMAGLQCLYCERTFKSSAVLRKHMRKKKHFKVNPRNHGYDRFYIINYLEPGKNWESYENERYQSDEDKDGNEWEDWDEPIESERTMCLFDEVVLPSANDVVEHMRNAHNFDLTRIKAEMGLDFYGVIRLINFLRLKAAHTTCFGCSQSFDTMEELTTHFSTTDHIQTMLPAKDSPCLQDPKYLFPTFDNDPLLSWDADDEDDDILVSAVEGVQIEAGPQIDLNFAQEQ
ncbi:hypothetical protein HDU76_006087 [Blyttiomyces sp. JEL0837]|nr:hypothetical protein HDU76_006087 [Blyttiomyces sp. JEL0837]